MRRLLSALLVVTVIGLWIPARPASAGGILGPADATNPYWRGLVSIYVAGGQVLPDAVSAASGSLSSLGSWFVNSASWSSAEASWMLGVLAGWVDSGQGLKLSDAANTSIPSAERALLPNQWTHSGGRWVEAPRVGDALYIHLGSGSGCSPYYYGLAVSATGTGSYVLTEYSGGSAVVSLSGTAGVGNQFLNLSLPAGQDVYLVLTSVGAGVTQLSVQDGSSYTYPCNYQGYGPGFSVGAAAAGGDWSGYSGSADALLKVPTLGSDLSWVDTQQCESHLVYWCQDPSMATAYATPTPSPTPALTATAVAQATGTAVAVSTATAQAQATATAQAQATATAQAQATATAQAQATATAQAQATATGQAQATATAIAMSIIWSQATATAQAQALAQALSNSQATATAVAQAQATVGSQATATMEAYQTAVAAGTPSPVGAPAPGPVPAGSSVCGDFSSVTAGLYSVYCVLVGIPHAVAVEIAALFVPQTSVQARVQALVGQMSARIPLAIPGIVQVCIAAIGSAGTAGLRIPVPLGAMGTVYMVIDPAWGAPLRVLTDIAMAVVLVLYLIGVGRRLLG